MNNDFSARVIGKEEDSLWNELAKNYVPKNLFYLSEWDAFFFAMFKRYPIRMLITRENQPVCLFKVFPVQSTRDRFGLSRSLVSGWPSGLGHINPIRSIVPINAEEFARILSLLEKTSRKYECSFVSLYFSSAEIDTKRFENLQYNTYIREKITIDLTKSEERLFKDMSRNSRRNIKKAEAKGMQLYEAHNRREMASYFTILEDTYQRLQLPHESFHLYESAWEHLVDKGLGRILLVELQDEVVGGVFLFQYMDTAYGWSAATSDKRSVVAPGHFMHWNVIRSLKKDGLKTYDIGERESLYDDRGIIRFKRELGADFTPVYVAQKVTKRIKYLLTDRLVIPLFHKAVNLKRALTTS